MARQTMEPLKGVSILSMKCICKAEPSGSTLPPPPVPTPRVCYPAFWIHMKIGILDHIDCAHFLPNHPKCGSLHGHTYRVELIVEGPVRDGMVMDFADLK